MCKCEGFGENCLIQSRSSLILLSEMSSNISELKKPRGGSMPGIFKEGKGAM